MTDFKTIRCTMCQESIAAENAHWVLICKECLRHHVFGEGGVAAATSSLLELLKDPCVAKHLYETLLDVVATEKITLGQYRLLSVAAQQCVEKVTERTLARVNDGVGG